MSPSTTIWVIAGGSFVIIVTVVAAVLSAGLQHPRSELAQLFEDSPSVVVWFHAVPPRPFLPNEAQRVMHDHHACDPADCPRKWAALDALIRSGHRKPTAARRGGRTAAVCNRHSDFRPATPPDSTYDTEEMPSWA